MANIGISSTEITGSGGGGAPLNSPHFTGIPTVPNAAPLTDDTQIANTKYVDDAVAAVVITGALPPLQTVSVTTASLAAGATENDTLTMAKSVSVLAVIVSAAARVRLYQTSAARTADASRTNLVPPTPGAPHQIIGDWYLTGAANAPLTFWCSPMAPGQNADGTTDGTQSTNIYAAITNIGTGSAAITVQLLYIPQES